MRELLRYKLLNSYKIIFAFDNLYKVGFTYEQAFTMVYQNILLLNVKYKSCRDSLIENISLHTLLGLSYYENKKEAHSKEKNSKKKKGC